MEEEVEYIFTAGGVSSSIPELVEQGLLKRAEVINYWQYGAVARWWTHTKAHLRFLFGFRFWEEDLLEELKNATSNLSQRNPHKFRELFESCGKAEYQDYIAAQRKLRQSISSDQSYEQEYR